MGGRFSLAGRTAVVTGGSGQLGKAFGAALAEAGARVVLADLKPLSKTELAALSQRPGALSSVRIDVTRRDSVRSAVRTVEREAGPIDVWVNNAGIAVFTPFAERTVAEFDKVLAVNVRGTFLCSQAVAPGMSRRRRGSIVNVGSIYGLASPDPGIYADSGRNSSEVYGASKAGVIQMTRWLAVHLAPAGVRVNAITPGGVFNRQSPAFVRNYRRKTPLGRMARAEDMQGALVYLASDASSYVTGHNLVVDGGYTAW